ncbi:hypothetical protein JTB14_001610 [Gonioctena quinquepunctata]|nr:hypothetical protein JTB14_001610 [Gonioctena quinquepunctata]
MEIKVCSTCFMQIKKQKIPPLSVHNGFKYPPIPECLKDFPLDLVSERLISPRIPFMQIRRLRHVHGQYEIYGQVINVQIEVNTMVQLLPRQVDDDHAITVHIERKKIHKSSYVYGIIRKRKIKVWLRYLNDTPLYTSYCVPVDDRFLNDSNVEVEEEIVFDEDGDNSAFYWAERKRDIFAMMRQLGKPTIFFIISANEIGWPKLLRLLHNIKHNAEISDEEAQDLHFIQKSTLINEDAVTCAMYFNKLVNILLKILQSKRYTPFQKYRILHYFKGIEFQHRGSPHAHILAWLDTAPEDALGRYYDEAIDLTDFLISISASEASGNIRLQTHKHTFTCYKGREGNKNVDSRLHSCR